MKIDIILTTKFTFNVFMKTKTENFFFNYSLCVYLNKQKLKHFCLNDSPIKTISIHIGLSFFLFEFLCLKKKIKFKLLIKTMSIMK